MHSRFRSKDVTDKCICESVDVMHIAGARGSMNGVKFSGGDRSLDDLIRNFLSGTLEIPRNHVVHRIVFAGHHYSSPGWLKAVLGVNPPDDGQSWAMPIFRSNSVGSLEDPSWDGCIARSASFPWLFRQCLCH